MLSLSAQPVPRPMPPGEPSPLDAALRRAFDAARDVPVDYAAVPWRFYEVGTEPMHALARLNAQRIEQEAGREAAEAAFDQWCSVPGWVVVTCLRVEDPVQQDHLRERCLTAVQRVSLSLWSEAESIRTSWITDFVMDDGFYRIVGIDPEQEQAIGILWYGHAEKRS